MSNASMIRSFKDANYPNGFNFEQYLHLLSFKDTKLEKIKSPTRSRNVVLERYSMFLLGSNYSSTCLSHT
jgi:hypothetical protein